MTFDVIVAADNRGGIGKDGGMPWPRLRGDLAHFKALTMGHAVIMGRKTWDSLPASARPLPGRQNITVTRHREGHPTVEGRWLAWSFPGALRDAAKEEAYGRRTFVIGGGEIYRLALAHPDCGNVYLTRVDAEYACDTFLPTLDGFACAEVMREVVGEAVPYRIERWTR